jgi:magnesium transporter
VATIVVDDQHVGHPPAADEISQKVKAKEFIWIDVLEPDTEARDLLIKDLGLPGDISDMALKMHQRPRIVDLNSSVALIVVYGLKTKGRNPSELHILVSEHFVITIHDHPLSGLEAIQHLNRQTNVDTPTPLILLHQIIDSIADGYFPRLAKLDDEIDEIEEEIFANPTDEQLQKLFKMKRELIALRRVVTPMRDMLGEVFNGVVTIPGFSSDTAGWLRDAYDHTIRISDLIDSYRDLLTGAMDVYLSTVSNRLNTVMKQLTVIATVFLPLSFFTGFFGQNFAFLTNHIQSAWTFWVLAIGIDLAIAVGMLILFRRRKWI